MTEIRISRSGLSMFIDNFSAMDISLGGLIAIISCSVAVSLALYVLRALGLYILAKKNGIKNAFLAWIPFLWVYTACMLISEYKLFGLSFKKIGVWVCVVFGVLQGIGIFINFISYFPYVCYFLEGGGDIVIEENAQGAMVLGVAGSPLNNVFDFKAMDVICSVLNYTSYFLDLAWIVCEVSLFICLFKKFWPEHYILASVLSIFGLFPIFVFAIRNKKAINYAEYFRNRYYGMYGNQYKNPNTGTQSERPPEQPFSEFEDKKNRDPGNPFSEFDEKGSNGNGSEHK